MDDLNLLMSLVNGIQGQQGGATFVTRDGNPLMFMQGGAQGDRSRPRVSISTNPPQSSSPGRIGTIYSGEIPPSAWIQREQRRNPMLFTPTSTANLDAHRLRDEGNNAFGQGRYQDAVDLYTRAIAIDPNCEFNFTNRSIAQYRLGNFDAAVTDGQEAVRLNPNYYKGYFRLGAGLMAKGELQSALENLKKALSLSPEENKDAIRVQIAKCESKIARVPTTPLIENNVAGAAIAGSPLGFKTHSVDSFARRSGEGSDNVTKNVDYDNLLGALNKAVEFRGALKGYSNDFEAERPIVECRDRAKRVRDLLSVVTGDQLQQYRKEAEEAQEELRQSLTAHDRSTYHHAKTSRDASYKKLWDTAENMEKSIKELNRLAEEEQGFYSKFGSPASPNGTSAPDLPTSEGELNEKTKENANSTDENDAVVGEHVQREDSKLNPSGTTGNSPKYQLESSYAQFDELLARRESIKHEINKVQKCVESTNAAAEALRIALEEEAKCTENLDKIFEEAKELTTKLQQHARLVAKTTTKELSSSRLEALEQVSRVVRSVNADKEAFTDSLQKGEHLLQEEAELERIRLIQERQRIQLQAEVEWCKVRDEPQHRILALQNQIKAANQRIDETNQKQRHVQKEILEIVNTSHPELAWKSMASGSRILKLTKGSGLWLNLSFSDFQIVSTLSSTVNSKVYHATWKGEHVALKEVAVDDDRARSRFQHEVQIVSSCSHPNIIKVKGVFFEGPFAYILLPYFSRGSIKTLLNQKEKFSWVSIQDMFRQIVSGIAYLHERGIVHADIKPSNILISSSGQPVITDFGIAKERGAFGELADVTTTQTNTDTISGTVQYMAPEQLGEKQRHAATCASDIWALGITFYQWAASNASDESSAKGVPSLPPLMPDEPGIEVEAKTVGGDSKMADMISSALRREPGRRPVAYALLSHPYFSSSLHAIEVNNFSAALAQSDERLDALRSFLHAMRRANEAKVLVSVSRNQMVDSLVEIFRNLTNEEIMRPIMTVFQGEAGIDEGALTTEMLNLFYEQLVSQKKAFVTPFSAEADPSASTGIINGATYLPAPDASLIPREIFELTGKVLLKNIVECRALPLQLNNALLKYFCGISPSLLDMEEYDPQLATTLKRLRILSAEELESSDLDFSIFSSEFLARCMEGRYTTHCVVNTENVKDYVELRVQYDLIESRKNALEALKKGFFSINEISNHLKLLSPSDLSLLLCGMQHVSPEAIISALEFQGFDSASNTPKYLKEVLREMNQNNLRRFLQLCTTSAALPTNDRTKKIRVIRAGDVQRLPVGHGCSNQLDLPDYNDKKKLEEKLSISLAHVSDGFHIV